jgi:uncharacterized protein YecT (DUF1311 family)
LPPASPLRQRFSVEGAVDPIDATLARCLDAPEGQSTAGSVRCYGDAYDAWDRALNAAFQALSASLDPRSRALLKRSQRQWLAFRDAERAFCSAPWARDRGSLGTVALNAESVGIVRERTLALRNYAAP